MAADQQFCLRWNNHQSTLISVFDTLLESETLVDCTLAAEGQYLKAHKVVLSACSPYLEVLLSQHYEKHPIVILKDVKFQELKSMMDYMYRGEVNISQDQLGTFLKAAESLQIKGLSDGGGGENDSRDVGSTPVTPKRHDPPRKVPPSVPPVPQPRNPSLLPHSQSNSGLSIEPRRPVPQHISDSAPESPSHRSREGSISPSLRKRRRTRRSSQGDDSNLDSHIDTSNSCDVPSQAQSTPLSTGIVPSIPASSMTPLVPSSSTVTKPPPIETEQNLQTDALSRLDNSNSLPPESGLIKEKIEPTNEVLLEPKTEYMEDLNNEDSVEDLTLDDDDEMVEGMDMARPGPSHGGDGSNQGFAPWHMTGNQSGTDEVFMAAQEAVGAAHRDSQGDGECDYDDDTNWVNRLQVEVVMNEVSNHGYEPPDLAETLPYKYPHHLLATLSTVQPIAEVIKSQLDENSECRYICSRCGRSYKHQFHLKAHSRECSQEPMFECPQCTRKFYHSRNLNRHLQNVHKQQIQTTHRRRRERANKKSKTESKESKDADDDSPLQSPKSK